MRADTTKKGVWKGQLSPIVITNGGFNPRGHVIMKTDYECRLQQIGTDLDKRLTTLDELRDKTEAEEAMVMQLLREQRLLEEKLNHSAPN